MPTDLNLISQYDTRYDEAYRVWGDFYAEAEKDLRMYLGDQWDQRERQQLWQEGRNAYVFNYVRRTVNMVSGYQRKNRLSSVVIPQEDKDQLAADQLTQLLLYVMNKGNGYQMISECFAGALKTGWNLASLWFDYRDDPLDGDIRFTREPYNAFICDPYFSNVDFSDCNYILRRKYVSLELAQSLLPERKKDLEKLYRIGWERDAKFTWLPYQRQPGGQNMLAYNEMWELKWRNEPMIVDMETAEFMEWDGPKDRIGAFLEMYPHLKVVDRPKQYVELSIIVNDQVMRRETNPYGIDEYPFVPFTCIFEPETDQWELKVQSLTRCIRDPQREANKRRSQMIDIMDSQLNSGWIAEEDSVINPRSLFQTGQGKVIWKKQGSQPGSIERIQPAQVPPSLFQLQQTFNQDMVEIAGINDAAFGMSENAQESGVLMLLRQGAALTNLQDLFDNLRFSQKAMSRKILKMIQQWSPKKLARILGADPSPELMKKDLTKYDVDVQEGILTDTQKQMYFRQLLDLKAAGAPVTGEMLAKAAPIQGKSEYIKDLQQMEQQQAQAAQQQQQLQNQLLQSQQQMSQAKAISDIALGKERFTRSIANLGLEDERAAKSVADRSKSALDKVRAMKELQTMDDDRLVKYLGIIRMMEEINQKEENQIKADDVQISAQATEPRQEHPPIGNPLGELPQNQMSEVPYG